MSQNADIGHLLFPNSQIKCFINADFYDRKDF